MELWALKCEQGNVQVALRNKLTNRTCSLGQEISGGITPGGSRRSMKSISQAEVRREILKHQHSWGPMGRLLLHN